MPRSLLGCVVLGLLLAIPLRAGDAARSLADEASYLSAKSGKCGWVSDEVSYTKDSGKVKLKGQLGIQFEADKGKPSGKLVTGIVDKGVLLESVSGTFELVEEGGKRSIKIKMDAQKSEIPLDYSLNKDVMTVKGGVVKGWAVLYEVDFAKAISFKAGK